MRLSVWFPLVLVALGCRPPCQDLGPSAPELVCQSPDAGAIVAGAPFVLTSITSLSDAGCTVSVDGGQLTIILEGGLSCIEGAGPAFAKPVVIKRQVRCEVPALPEGTYVVTTSTPLTFSFTLPDAGIPACP